MHEDAKAKAEAKAEAAGKARRTREEDLTKRSSGLDLKHDKDTLEKKHAVEMFAARDDDKQVAELTKKHAAEKRQFNKDKAHDKDLRKNFDEIHKSEKAIKDHEGKAQDLKNQHVEASKAKTELDEKHAAALHTLSDEGGNKEALSAMRQRQKGEKDKAEKRETDKLAEISKHDEAKKALIKKNNENISKNATLAEDSRMVQKRHKDREDRFSKHEFVDASERHKVHLARQQYHKHKKGASI